MSYRNSGSYLVGASYLGGSSSSFSSSATTSTTAAMLEEEYRRLAALLRQMRESRVALQAKWDAAMDKTTAAGGDGDDASNSNSNAQKWKQLQQRMAALAVEENYILLQMKDLSDVVVGTFDETKEMLLKPADPPSCHRSNDHWLNLSKMYDAKPLTSFPFFATLKALCLSRNGLKEIPDEVLKLPQLERLDLSQNSIQVIPKSLGMLKKLTYLSLSHNSLVSMDSGWSEGFTSLRTLVLNHNQLTSDGFEGEMQEAVALTVFSASHNKLDCLPLTLCVNCRELRRIYVDHNAITVLPSEVIALQRLELINMDWNQLAEIPESLQKLTSLLAVGIAHNQLTSLPVFPSCITILKTSGNLIASETPPPPPSDAEPVAA